MGLANSRQEAFWEACGFGHIHKAKYLLEAGDIDVNWVSYTNECCPIHTASQGKKEIVKLLLQYNCDVNVRDIRGNLPLHHAAMKGHTDIVKMLLDAGSQIDVQEKNGWTALHNAAYWCHPEVVRLLIKQGANVHLQNKDERTALHECARSQQKDDTKLAEIAQMLIDAGSDINAKSSDFGEADLTGLMFAAFHNHPEVAAVLITAGCELDAIGTTFWTALHWAADRENDELVYVLLDAGANPTKRCLKGETAYDRAKSEPIREILSTAMQLHRDLNKVDTREALPVLKQERTARAETIYKPLCNASFKSQSFLPGNWKPSSSVDVKNLINEKKARLAAMTKQQYRNDLAKRTGSNTVITDKDKDNSVNDKTEQDADTSDSVEKQGEKTDAIHGDKDSIGETEDSLRSDSIDDDTDDISVEKEDVEDKVIEHHGDTKDTVAQAENQDNQNKSMQDSSVGEQSVSSPSNVKEMIKAKKSRLASMTKQEYRNELAKRTGSKNVVTDVERSEEVDSLDCDTASSNEGIDIATDNTETIREIVLDSEPTEAEITDKTDIDNDAIVEVENANRPPTEDGITTVRESLKDAKISKDEATMNLECLKIKDNKEDIEVGEDSVINDKDKILDIKVKDDLSDNKIKHEIYNNSKDSVSDEMNDNEVQDSVANEISDNEAKNEKSESKVKNYTQDEISNNDVNP